MERLEAEAAERAQREQEQAAELAEMARRDRELAEKRTAHAEKLDPDGRWPEDSDADRPADAVRPGSDADVAETRNGEADIRR